MVADVGGTVVSEDAFAQQSINPLGESFIHRHIEPIDHRARGWTLVIGEVAALNRDETLVIVDARHKNRAAAAFAFTAATIARECARGDQAITRLEQDRATIARGSVVAETALMDVGA